MSEELRVQEAQKHIEDILKGTETGFTPDEEDFGSQIAERILSAESLEDADVEVEPEAWRDYLDEPVTIHAVRWLPSQYDEGPSMYAAIDAVIHSTGERKPLLCGAVEPMAKLALAVRLDKLPVDMVLTEKPTPTKSGFKPLRAKLYKKGK